jgi:ribonuclease Z
MMLEPLPKRMLRRLTFLVVLCIFFLAPALATPAASTDDVTVTLLGTGIPLADPDRFGPSTLVEVGGQRLVFDLGRGCTIRLWQKQIPLGSIDAHFLTHLHSDHINGLPDLYLSGWIQTAFGSRKKPFLIYGPNGTKKMMDHLWEAFSEDRRIRIEEAKYPLAGIQIDAHDFQPGVVYEKDGVVVTTFEVDHGSVKPAFGFKITYKKHSVVISGDTRYNQNVEKAALGVDLLIHEVAMVPEKLFAEYPVYRTTMAHHISPEEAGKLFAVSKPKLAVFTHLVLSGLPAKGIPFPTLAELLAATGKTYSGRVVVGADLMSFKLTDNGVTIVEPTKQ